MAEGRGRSRQIILTFANTHRRKKRTDVASAAGRGREDLGQVSRQAGRQANSVGKRNWMATEMPKLITWQPIPKMFSNYTETKRFRPKIQPKTSIRPLLFRSRLNCGIKVVEASGYENVS